jgi:CheY-like chemotaxis protein
MTPTIKSVRVLIVDDNPIVRNLMAQGFETVCEVSVAVDGAEALLQAIEKPPDLIISDFKMPGLDGRQLYEKLRARENTRNIPFIFVASRGDIEEKLRPLSDSVEDIIAKPFFVTDLVRRAKKTIDRLHLEKLQKRAARPGMIQGRLEEMGITELMQSLEMGQKSCRLTMRRGSEKCELFFTAGQCKHAKSGDVEGDEAVYAAIDWLDGEFEIDFNVTNDRATTTRSTTGLLMEAMRRMDEESHKQVES